MDSPLLKRRVRLDDWLIKPALFLCAAASVATTFGIIFVLLGESLQFFKTVPLARYLTEREWTPLFENQKFGIMPLVCGTFLTSAVALVIAGPLGLLIAMWLSEYARPGVRKAVKPFLEFLAGIPTVVYGYFALLFVTPLLQKARPSTDGFNALSAGLVMALMILPMVASLSEDAFFAVPTGLRQAAFGLGYTRLQCCWKVVFPSALSGVSASLILGLARAVGETMIVAIAAGMQPNLTLNPLQTVQTLTSYIVQVSMGDTPHGTLEYHTIYAVGATLFLMTLALNSLALWLRERFRRAYA